MPTIQEAIKHPAFKTLPHEEQKKVFSRLSPEYNRLPAGEQGKVIDYYSSDVPTKRGGATGTWETTLEGKLREKYPKSMAVAQGASDLLTPVAYDSVKNLSKGDISSAMRSTLETSGGVGGSMLKTPLAIPGYMAGKRIADIVDVGLLGKSYEDLPKSLFADYLLNKVPTIDEGIAQYHPQNMLMNYLKKPPQRGTILGELSQTARDAIDALLMQSASEGTKAGYEKTAPYVKKAYGFVKSHIPWKSKEALEKMAATELTPIVEGIQNEDKYGKTYKESMALKKEIPNAEYTLGQASGEPNAIMTERRFARGETGANPEKAELQKLKTGLAGREYVQQYFPEGEENIDEVIKGTQQKRNLLRNRLNTANQKFAESITSATPQGDLAKINYNKGQEIFEKARRIKGEKYAQASELYDKIPNIRINMEELLDDALKLKENFKAFGTKPEDFPESVYNNLLNRISEVYPDGTRVAKNIPFQELRGVRSSIKQVLRNVSSSENPNAITKHYLEALSNDRGNGIIEKALSKIGDVSPIHELGNQAKQAWREADKFYKTDYIPSVRQRTVNSILTPGGGGTPTKYDYSAIPDKFTKNVDTAKDYTRIFGKGDKDIQDVMMVEMLNKSQNTTTKQVNREIANRWYGNNRGVLEELGIQKPFQNIIRSQESLEAAAQNLDGFNQSILSKVLEADPQHAISKAFSGNTKNTAHVMRSMLQSLPDKNTPIGAASHKGLKRAFVDFLFDNSQRELASDIAEEVGKSPIVNINKRGSLLKQYSGAMNVLFSDEPQKLAALKNFQLNSEIITRNIKSPIGGGSDTKELLSKDVSRIAGIGLQGFGAKIKVLRIMSRYYALKVESQVNQIIEKALYDPEYAFTLVNAYKSPQLFEQRMNNHLAELGVYGMGAGIIQKKEDMRQRNQNQPEWNRRQQQ